MFVIVNEKTKLPIKVWLPNESYIEDSCLEQAYHLSNLPFLHQWVALMPDTHMGMGMPIGGIIATNDVIIPNAVGVDIGCGMMFVSTTIPVEEIRYVMTPNGSLFQAMIGDILRNVPVGFSRHKHTQSSLTLDIANGDQFDRYEQNSELLGVLEAGYFQIGTLGGGNHFIELQEDDQGFLGIMIHSGSRNLGKQICDYFHTQAHELNKKWHTSVPDTHRLAFLPVTSKAGQQYINWMQLALDFAMENRQHMMFTVKSIMEKWIGKHTDVNFEYTMEINCHHNYAAIEHHYGKNVWVHRKGATRAREGELAVIPGAMGASSYVVEGLGNEESFHSCSHGAGRNYSRKAATQKFTVDEVMGDLHNRGVILGKNNKKDVAEESRFAYKNIDEVMENQQDLVKPVKQLKTIGVVKG